MSGIRRFTKDADSLAEGNVILIIYLAFADPKPLQWGFFYLWICGKRILKLRRENLIETILRWLIGLAFSLLIGHFVTNLFVTKLRRYLNLDEQWIVENVDFGHRFIPPLLMGTLERLFFLILIAFDVSAVSAGIMTWVLIKMATNWNRINPPKGEEQDQVAARLRIYAVSALLGTLVSMLFAILGGLICKGSIWWWPC